MNNIPTALILKEIVERLENKDKLNLALTSKWLYQAFFDYDLSFKEHYGLKYKIGDCLHEMMNFVKKDHLNVCYWCFSCPKQFFNICRINKTDYLYYNGKYFAENDFMELFKTHLFPKWDYIALGSACYYKSKNKRKEFSDLTIQMQELLSYSLKN